ncbi:MAG: hypothetical protein KDA59_25060 [Planctomycetales bacterium]|nr:hypothetical protein [Planctomycetales bacterium]MCA9226485.1 hypothetical protein [Planctomycetales bacterium]
MSETVRIKPETHAKLKELSQHYGEPMPAILERAIDRLQREVFLEQVNRSFAALRDDPKAWAEEQAERRAWDATLADGLEND